MHRAILLWTVLAMVTATVGCDAQGSGQHPSSAPTTAPASPSVVSAPRTRETSQAAPNTATNQDPARFAGQVRTHAQAAAVSPQLLMAILYNDSYKPHDPALERAWQKIDPNAAFGVANMHKAAFDQTKRGRDFADRAWEELPDDPDLAIKAAAWHLHGLAAQLPATWSGSYIRDELLLGLQRRGEHDEGVSREASNLARSLRRTWTGYAGTGQRPSTPFVVDKRDNRLIDTGCPVWTIWWRRSGLWLEFQQRPADGVRSTRVPVGMAWNSTPALNPWVWRAKSTKFQF